MVSGGGETVKNVNFYLFVRIKQRYDIRENDPFIFHLQPSLQNLTLESKLSMDRSASKILLFSKPISSSGTPLLLAPFIKKCCRNNLMLSLKLLSLLLGAILANT